MTKIGKDRKPAKKKAMQDQTSAQSIRNPSQANKQAAREHSRGDSRGNQGLDTAQDVAGPDNKTEAGERPSAGTPDLPRDRGQDDAHDIERGYDSLVNDSTGAFKERP